jgi:hypothetical protein
MKIYDQIKDMLCDELEDIVKQKEISPHNLEVLDTAIDVIKDIETIEAMKQEFGDGYSRDGGYSQGYWGRMPYYMYDDNPNQGNSYARGRGSNAARDSRGRYYEGGYSGDTKSELEKLMRTAENDREREAIRSALDHMNR